MMYATMTLRRALAVVVLGGAFSVAIPAQAAPVLQMGGAGGEDTAAAERARMLTSRTRALIAEATPKLAEVGGPATKAILKKLEEPVAMSFPNDTPLADVLKYVQQTVQGKDGPGIPIYVDPAGLQEAEKTLQSPVSIELNGVPLKTSLRLLLKQLDLAYCVCDGLLIISNPSGVLDELREFESSHVEPDKRILPPTLLPGGMGGGMGGGFR